MLLNLKEDPRQCDGWYFLSLTSGIVRWSIGENDFKKIFSVRNLKKKKWNNGNGCAADAWFVFDLFILLFCSSELCQGVGIIFS